jgi:hypothetical protein
VRDSNIVQALIIGIDRYDNGPLRGAVADARRWERVARAAGAGVEVLTDGDATRRRILAAFLVFLDALKRARAHDPTACGLLVFCGHGDQPDKPGTELTRLCPVDHGTETAPDGIRIETLSDVLDAAFGTDPAAASILAVLDCGFAHQEDPLAREGRRLRCASARRWRGARTNTGGGSGGSDEPGAPVLDGPLAAAAGLVPEAAKRELPRLRHHARLITARPQFRVAESLGPDGAWGGDLTRTALAIRGFRDLDLPIIGREIGPGNAGFLDWDIRDADGLGIGRMLCTGNQPPTALTPRKAQWWWSGTPFPVDFSLHVYDDVNYRSPITGGDLYDDLPFPTPQQSAATLTNFVAWRLGLNAADGAFMGYLWNKVDGNGGVTDQWWSCPAGAVDNHGFLALGATDSLYFHKLAQQPYADPDWRWVKTR